MDFGKKNYKLIYIKKYSLKMGFQFYISIIISNLFIIFIITIIIIIILIIIKFNDNTNIDNQIIYVSNSIYNFTKVINYYFKIK